MALKYTIERRERWARLEQDPDLIDTICCHIASGGSLVDLAETYDIPYGWLMNWIRADKTRNERFMHSLNDRAEWAIETILRELRRLGLSDIRKLYNEDGSLKLPKDWDAETASAVAGLEVDELFEGTGREREQVGHTKKVKMWDKVSALEKLGKNLKLFTERHEHTIDKKLEDIIASSMTDTKDSSGDETK